MVQDFSLFSFIGNTPLVFLKKFHEQTKVQIFVKLEYFNPGKSIKDRPAYFMIEDAQQKGLITPHTQLIEPTSGNTGIGLAWICAQKNISLTLVMPENVSEERKKLLLHLGAKLILTPKEDGMTGAVKKVKEILEETKNTLFLDQFSNPANPKAHYESTAPEIWKAFDGKFDVFVAGVGSGGTLSGCGQFFKERKPISIIAVEPTESPVLAGGKPNSHGIQGIGAGFVPKNYNSAVVDEIIHVSTQDAIETAKALAREEGILSGISGGANVFASLQLGLRNEYQNKIIVTVIPDLAERYMSTPLFF
jgi:cysteine synthase A